MSTERSEMFSKMAYALHHEKVPEATVELIVGYARSAIRCDEVGVMIARRYKVETPASTSPIVRRADQLQQSLREGPGIMTGDGASHVLIDDTATDDRWPRWAEQVALLGIRSVLSIRLETADRTFGALNLYSRLPHSFTASDVAVATTFARHSSVALASSAEIFNLKIAVDGRKVLGQAQGILMERFEIGADRAFDVLRRFSQTSNVKLSVVAQQVVDERRLPVTDAAPVARVDVRDRERAELTPIAFASRDEADFHIISVTGEIDIYTAPDFVETALAALDAGHVNLVIDMQKTSFIDSSGLSAFVLVRKAATKLDGSLDVIGVVDRVHRLFAMAGLDQVIHLHPTLDRAKESHVALGMVRSQEVLAGQDANRSPAERQHAVDQSPSQPLATKSSSSTIS